MFSRISILAIASSVLVAYSAAADVGAFNSTQAVRMLCQTSQGPVTLDFEKAEGKTKDGKAVKAVVLYVESAQMVIPAEPLAPLFQRDLEKMNGVALPLSENGQILFTSTGHGGFGVALARITIAMKNAETGKVDLQILRDCALINGRIGF